MKEQAGWTRRGKRLIGRLFGSLALLLVALLLLPQLVPKRWIAPRLTATVERATGRNLSIKGGLDIWLLPTPGISAERVSLANPSGWGKEPLLRASRIEVWLSAWSLLLGRPALTEVDLYEPNLALATDASGRGNWRLRRPPSAITVPPATSSPAVPPSSSAALTSTPAKQKMAAAAPKLRLPRLPRLDLKRLPRAIYVLDGHLSYRSGTSHRVENVRSVYLTLTMPELHAPLHLAGSAHWEGRLWEVEAMIADPGGLAHGPSSPLHATIKTDEGRFDLKGRLALAPEPRADLTLALDIVPPPHETSHLLRRIGRKSLGLRVKLENRYVAIDRLLGKDAAGATFISGHLAVDASALPFVVTGRIDLGAVDLDPFLPPPSPQPAATGTLPSAPKSGFRKPLRQWRDRPFELAALREVNADLAVDGGPVRLRSVLVGPGALRLWIKGGVARLDVSKIPVGEGRLDLAAKLDASDDESARLRLDLVADHIALAPLLGSKPRMVRRGTLDLDAHFAASGLSERMLVGSLDGRLRFDLAGAELELDALNHVLHGVLAGCPGSLEDERAWGAAAIEHGRAAVSRIALSGASLSLLGSGNLDLPDRRLDFTVVGDHHACVRRLTAKGLWNDLAVHVAR